MNEKDPILSILIFCHENEIPHKLIFDISLQMVLTVAEIMNLSSEELQEELNSIMKIQENCKYQ